MSTFVFAVLAGFCIHRLTTIIQPLTSKKPVQFRRFVFGPGVVLRIPTISKVSIGTTGEIG